VVFFVAGNTLLQVGLAETAPNESLSDRNAHATLALAGGALGGLFSYASAAGETSAVDGEIPWYGKVALAGPSVPFITLDAAELATTPC
jgi:hypothetical protein